MSDAGIPHTVAHSKGGCLKNGGLYVTHHAAKQYARRVLGHELGEDERLPDQLWQRCVYDVLFIARNGTELSVAESALFMREYGTRLLHNLDHPEALEALRHPVSSAGAGDYPWGKYQIHDDVIIVTQDGRVRTVITPTEEQLVALDILREYREGPAIEPVIDSVESEASVDDPETASTATEDLPEKPVLGAPGIYILSYAIWRLPSQERVFKTIESIGGPDCDVYAEKRLRTVVSQLADSVTLFSGDEDDEQGKQNFLWLLHRLLLAPGDRKSVIVCGERAARSAVLTIAGLMQQASDEIDVRPNRAYFFSPQHRLAEYVLD